MREKDHDQGKHHHRPAAASVERDETAVERMKRADKLVEMEVNEGIEPLIGENDLME